MAKVNPDPHPWRGDVRISVPASVLYDLEEFQRAQAAILGQTGCPTCTSGMNFFWQVYSEFAVNPAGEVRPVLGDEPVPQPWFSAGAQGA